MERRLDPAKDIDWETDGTWVRRRGALQVLERDAGWVHVRHPSGGEITLTRAHAEANYQQVANGALLEPRSMPVQAHCAAAPTSVVLPCGTVRLAEGDVLLNDGGHMSVVRSAVFQRDFVQVA